MLWLHIQDTSQSYDIDYIADILDSIYRKDRRNKKSLRERDSYGSEARNDSASASKYIQPCLPTELANGDHSDIVMMNVESIVDCYNG